MYEYVRQRMWITTLPNWGYVCGYVLTTVKIMAYGSASLKTFLYIEKFI